MIEKENDSQGQWMDQKNVGTKRRHGESEAVIAKGSDRPKEQQEQSVLHLIKGETYPQEGKIRQMEPGVDGKVQQGQIFWRDFHRQRLLLLCRPWCPLEAICHWFVHLFWKRDWLQDYHSKFTIARVATLTWPVLLPHLCLIFVILKLDLNKTKWKLKSWPDQCCCLCSLASRKKPTRRLRGEEPG